MQQIQQIFTLYSLVDITKTGKTRGDGSLERDQQRNYETVLQAVGIVSQPHELSEPVCYENTPMSWLNFGDFFEGEHSVWVWEFCVDRSDVFAIGTNPIGRLSEVFDQVPVITGLTETARFMLPIFYPYGSIKNIYFKNGQKNINNI